jgi:hypothetical protein
MDEGVRSPESDVDLASLDDAGVGVLCSLEREDVGMHDPQTRPTTDVRDVILSSMDRMFEQLMERVDGLTDREYLWEPAPESWSVRSIEGGAAEVDGAGVRDVIPAPVTTIAWRMWHIAIDCFDDYTRRFEDDVSEAQPHWTMDASEAVEATRQKWQQYRELVEELDWWQELGDSWDSWSRHSVADMAMHASNELVHHGAEIGLLRDLYRSSETAVGR